MTITNSLGFIIKCQKPIELDGGHTVIYCILDAEHEGKCKPDEGIAKAYGKYNIISNDPRCTSTHNGVRCGFPKAHQGYHSSGRVADTVKW